MLSHTINISIKTPTREIVDPTEETTFQAA
jgi:hypothetical protein